MLAILQEVPNGDAEWSRWSYSNWDALNQIRQAILAQYEIELAEYQVEPIPWNDIDTWLVNNQQAHTDFNNILQLQSSDLQQVDFDDASQRQTWIWLNFWEVYQACQKLKIGP